MLLIGSKYFLLLFMCTAKCVVGHGMNNNYFLFGILTQYSINNQ